MKLKRKLTPLFFGLVLMASLLMATFSPFLQGTAVADYGDDAAGCSFSYTAGGDEIDRTGCANSQLGDLTYKDDSSPFTKFSQTSDDLGCTQTITVKNPGDRTGVLSGKYEKDNKSCVSFTKQTVPIGVQDSNGNAGCEGNNLSWILCPVIEGLQGMVGGIYDNLIKPLLVTKPLDTVDSSTNGALNAWKNFRIYGNIFLVIALLVIVFGESIGGGLIDAYTAKKILPRLLIAAILINLSFYIVAVLVDIMNIVGNGVINLITTPFGLSGDFSIELGTTGAISFVGLIAAASAYLWVSFLSTQAASFVIFIILLPLALVMLAILATILIRWALIIFLVIIAPVAFALYCLPNTEKYFRQWWEILVKTLLVYPIIAALFAMGKVSAYLLSTATDTSTLSNPIATTTVGGIADLLAIIAFMVPLFMIPFSFKIAGGVLGSAFGALDGWRGRGHKFTEGTRQRIATQAGKNRIQARQKYYSEWQARASDTNRSRMTRGTYKLFNKAMGGYNIEASASAARADTLKTLNDQIATGKDEEIRGLTVNKRTSASRVASNGRRQFQSLGGAWIDEADVDAGYSRWGRDTYAQQAALSYEMRKAGTEEEVASIAQNFSGVATGPGGWGNTDGQASGTWIGAAFEHQNDHLEYKHTDWKTGTMDADKARKFVNEVYEKKGSYPMAQNGSNTVKALQDIYAGGLADADMQTKIAGIAETFTNDRGMAGPTVVPGAEPGAAPEMVTGPRPGAAVAAGGRMTNAPGPAHFNERINELARMTGVIHAEPVGQYANPQENPQGAPTPTNVRIPGPEAAGGHGRSQKT